MSCVYWVKYGCMLLQGPIPRLQNAQALPLLRAFVVAQKVKGRQHFRFEAGDWAKADPATGLPPDKGKHLLTAINTGRYHRLHMHVALAWQQALQSSLRLRLLSV